MAKQSLTPEQKAIDAMIKRINRKIAGIAKLGSESRQYQQIMTVLGDDAERSWGTMSGEMTLQNKKGYLQLSRSKAALGLYSLDQYQRALRQIDRMQSASAARKAMIEAYKARTGIKVKTKAEKEAAVQAELLWYQQMQGKLERALMEMYRIEAERSIYFEGHREIKKKSKGRWTSSEELEEMLDIAQRIANEEDQRIIKNATEGW